MSSNQIPQALDEHNNEPANPANPANPVNSVVTGEKSIFEKISTSFTNSVSACSGMITSGDGNPSSSCVIS